MAAANHSRQLQGIKACRRLLCILCCFCVTIFLKPAGHQQLSRSHAVAITMWSPAPQEMLWPAAGMQCCGAHWTDDSLLQFGVSRGVAWSASEGRDTTYLAGRSRFLRTSAGGKLTLEDRGRQAAMFLGVCKATCKPTTLTFVVTMFGWACNQEANERMICSSKASEAVNTLLDLQLRGQRQHLWV